MKRVLHHIPMVHGEADLGTLAAAAQSAAAAPSAWRSKQERIAQMWRRIGELVDSIARAMPSDLSGVRVFQDGLPVSPQAELIVADLAARGSANHRLIQRMLVRGATLEGTESPDLLLEEYRLVQTALAAAARAPGTVAPLQPTSTANIAHSTPAVNPGDLAARGADLLRRRDRFIADRIHATLREGETAFLFIGLLHNVPAALAQRGAAIQLIDHRATVTALPAPLAG